MSPALAEVRIVPMGSRARIILSEEALASLACSRSATAGPSSAEGTRSAACRRAA